MSEAPSLHLLIYLAVALLLFWTCFHDIATRTLPDWNAIAIAGLGLLGQVIAGDLAWSLLAAALVFLGAAVIWYLGALGGGDVKLLGACALLPSPASVPVLLVMTALAGGALALAYLAARRLAPAMGARPHRLPARIWRAEAWRMRRGGPLPYALPISFGTLFAMIERV